VIKRSLDIALAALLLIVSLPGLAVAALLIKRDSEGPILFRQERMGRDFKKFQLLKLRTMRELAGGSAITLGVDPRITRVGRWLRYFKIDELPQLWNVLRGDMSLVGPRPVIPEIAREFKKSYRSLLTVRPGLTDPATLKYCREAEMLASLPDPAQYFKTVATPDKLEISLLYQERATVFGDLCVLAATALAILLPTDQTLLNPSENSRDYSFEIPVPVPEMKIPRRRIKVPVEAPFEYPLDLPKRDQLGRIKAVPVERRRSEKAKAADRPTRLHLVP
jgi:lipopolysaccharide/colanic/teichoic acid biosynthesis glycosyltransferase